MGCLVGFLRLLRVLLVVVCCFFLGDVLSTIILAVGLIFALLISSLSGLIYSLVLARKRFGVGINFRRQLMVYLASFLSALPSILFLHLISFGSSFFNSLLNFVVGAVIYLIVYLTLLPLLRVIDEHDVENLRQIFERMKFLWPLIRLLIDYEVKLLRIVR